MKKTRGGNTFDELMEIVGSDPASLSEFKVETLRIALSSSLKKARGRAGKTQREIARALGVRQPWVSKLESCNNDHTLESLAKYAFALGADITLGMVFGGTEHMELASSKDRPSSGAKKIPGRESTWPAIASSKDRPSSGAKKYRAGRLPEFIRLVDDSTADRARRGIWNLDGAGPESQPQPGFYVA